MDVISREGDDVTAADAVEMIGANEVDATVVLRFELARMGDVSFLL
jgi:hypothetical protein